MKVRSGVDDREATLVELGGEVKWTIGSETIVSCVSIGELAAFVLCT